MSMANARPPSSRKISLAAWISVSGASHCSVIRRIISVLSNNVKGGTSTDRAITPEPERISLRQVIRILPWQTGGQYLCKLSWPSTLSNTRSHGTSVETNYSSIMLLSFNMLIISTVLPVRWSHCKTKCWFFSGVLVSENSLNWSCLAASL